MSQSKAFSVSPIEDGQRSESSPRLITRAPTAVRESLSYEEAEHYAAQFRPSWASSLRPIEPRDTAEVVEVIPTEVAWLQVVRRHRLRLVAGAVVGCALLCGLLWMSQSNGPPPSGRSPSKAAPTPQQGTGSDTPFPAQASEPAKGFRALAEDPKVPKSARLRVTTVPPSAEVWLDGHPVSNPFLGDLPRAGEAEIIVRAPGYQPRRLSVRGGVEQQLTVVLSPTTP